MQEFTKSALKERGWSDRLIAQCLGRPDRTAESPYRRSGPPIQLWAIQRVIEAEAQPAFMGYQADRKRRSEAGRQAAARRARELMAAIDGMKVTIERIDPERVLDLSLQDWEMRQIDRGRYDSSGYSAPSETRARWAVNFIRHRLSTYDRALQEVAGRAGVAAAVGRIGDRILEAIAATYPEFAEEVERQRGYRQERVRVEAPRWKEKPSPATTDEAADQQRLADWRAAMLARLGRTPSGGAPGV